MFAPRADRADAATIWFEAFDFDFELGAHTQTSRLEQLTRLKVCMRNVALAGVDLSQPPGLVMTWLRSLDLAHHCTCHYSWLL